MATITLTHGHKCHCGRYANRHIEIDGQCGNVCGVHGRKGKTHDRAVYICKGCGEHISSGGWVTIVGLLDPATSGDWHRECHEQSRSPRQAGQ